MQNIHQYHMLTKAEKNIRINIPFEKTSTKRKREGADLYIQYYGFFVGGSEKKGRKSNVHANFKILGMAQQKYFLNAFPITEICETISRADRFNVNRTLGSLDIRAWSSFLFHF